MSIIRIDSKDTRIASEGIKASLEYPVTSITCDGNTCIDDDWNVDAIINNFANIILMNVM